MPTLTELPCEIIAAILKSLYDVQSLAHCLLTCRHLHLSMKEYPGVAISIVQQQVTPLLLPYAVCLVEVSDPATFDPGSPPTKLLGMLLDSPAQLADRLHLLDFRRLVRISYMHSLVEKYAFEHARDAWTILSQRSGPDAPTNLSLSSAESFRFCRAFYRLELISVLCCKSRVAVAAVDRICGRFFSRLPPWEIGQLGCAHDFLDKKFLQGQSLSRISHNNANIGW